MLYWLLKWIFIGPLLKAVFRPEAYGAEYVPDEGPAILACNHLSYTDWLFMTYTRAPRPSQRMQVRAGNESANVRCPRCGGL